MMLLSRRKINKTILLLATIAVVAAFYSLTIRDGQQWGDFSQYVQHAKNIVEGESYGNTGYIFNPGVPWASQLYPPVFPLLLSPLYKLFGLNLTAMKIEMVIFFIAALVAIWLLFKQNLRSVYLLFIVVLIGFNPYFWNFKENIVSDIPFLLFSCLCLHVLNRTYDSEDFSLRNVLASAILLYLAFGTRALGILFLVVLAAYDVIRFRRPSGFLLRVAGLFAAFVVLQQSLIMGFPAYSEEFYFSLKAVYRNLITYGRFLSLFWHNGYFLIPTVIISLSLLALAVSGYIARIRERLTVLELYMPIHLGVVMIWPHSGEGRYLIPVLPIYLFYVFVGLDKIRCSAVVKRILLSVLILGIGISYAGNYSRMNYGHIDGATNQECVELFDHIKEETSPADVILFTRPRVLSFYTQRKSAVFPFEWEHDRIWNYLEEISADYIVAGEEYFDINFVIGKAKVFGLDHQYVIPFIRQYPSRFRLTYRNKGFSIYKIIPR
jgi:hypothetical protein